MLFKPSAFVAAALFTIISGASYAQGVTTPRTPSPASSVSQTIGISTVTVKYSRPAVKGREIWGSLVPYGWNKQGFGTGNEAPWRAGANENTVIEFSHDAKVEGKMVPAGSYGLFFVVNPGNTGEVVLSKDYRSWGSFFYDAKNDVLRSKIQLRPIPNTELLTYDFGNLTKNAAELQLNWEKKQFPVKIEYDVDKIVLANAAEELKGPMGFGWQGYVSAANYALQNNTGYEQALKWTDKTIAMNKSFATMRLKADLLKQMGNSTEGDAMMRDALATATENELNAYGYQLLNQGDNDKAIQILLLNTQRFPRSANTFDSLGETYFNKGDKKNASMSFKKALTLNPSDATKANSEKFLKQIGSM